MTRLEALVSLNMVSDIGSVRLAMLMEAFGSPENIFKASYERLMQIFGIGEEIATKITSFKQEDLEKEFALVKQHNLKIIAVYDNDYPENLKNIPGAPIVLYVRGKLREEDKLAIGIVGSRGASFYGLNNAQKFAYDLSQKGFTIVSGMARGIDTYAHRGALKAGGRTIAIMGSGFNHIYPEENKKLSEEIVENGAVISEFPVNTIPFKQNFPRRNRVISGLSLGVLVAEAARNSGALITADFALEQGREVFALPGKVDSNTSYGTNELIKQGAKLVTCADDIAEEFVFPKENSVSHNIGIKEEENELYGMISDESIQLDELVEKTSMDITRISDILLRLQLKKMIKQLPGRQFVRLRPLSFPVNRQAP
jgi:DNA processing protein